MEKLPVEEFAQKTKIERKPLAVKVGGFLKKQKYLLMIFIVLIGTVAIRALSIDFNWKVQLKEITFPLIIVCIFTYLGFWIMTDWGRDLGKNSKEYMQAIKAYWDIYEKIRDKQYNNYLKDFCEYKRKLDIEEARKEYLMDSTISYDYYLEHYKGKSKKQLQESGLSAMDVELIDKANTYKAPKLQYSMLWQRNSYKQQVDYLTKSGAKKLRVRRIIKAVLMCATTGISVGMYASSVWAFDWLLLYQIICILVNMYIGFRDGYNAYSVEETQYYTCKTELLLEHYEWCEKQNFSTPLTNTTLPPLPIL